MASACCAAKARGHRDLVTSFGHAATIAAGSPTSSTTQSGYNRQKSLSSSRCPRSGRRNCALHHPSPAEGWKLGKEGEEWPRMGAIIGIQSAGPIGMVAIAKTPLHP